MDVVDLGLGDLKSIMFMDQQFNSHKVKRAFY